MADLTLKLVWYRLNEGGLNMASALLGIFGEFDVLNLLLLGWMLLTGLVFSLVTFYQRAVEARRGGGGLNTADGGGSGCAASGTSSKEPSVGGVPSAVGLPTASCAWINSVALWLQLHSAGSVQTVQAVLLSLSEESRHLADDVAISFDNILSGSVVPKVTAIAAEASSSPNLVLNARVEFHDLRLAVRISRPALPSTGAAQNQQHAILNLQKLSGKVKLQLTYVRSDDLSAVVHFDEDCSVQAELEECIDVGQPVCGSSAQSTLRGAASGTGGILRKSSISGSAASKSASHQSISSDLLQKHLLQVLRSATVKLQIPGLTCEMVPASSQLRSLAAAAGSSGPPKPPRTPPKLEVSSDGKVQLMIKLRKATGLGAPNAGNTSPYCKIELDYPVQAYITSVVQNTVNPYWDEHFLFQISLGSKAIKFSIYDKEKKPPDDFLGQAVLDLDKIRTSNPGCVQVLPLAEAAVEYGRISSCVSGSITVEMQFMESPSDDGETNGPAAAPNSVQPLSSDNVPAGKGQSVPSPQQQQQRHLAVPGNRSSPLSSSTAAATVTAAAQADSAGRAGGRYHGSDRQQPAHVSSLLQRSRSSILHTENSLDADTNADWSPDRDMPTFGNDDARSSIGRSETDIFRSLDLNNAEVVIVSSEQMADVAVRELRRQLMHPGVSGSRTSTVVITSVHKEPIHKVGDEPYSRSSEYGSSCATPPERPPSDGTNSAADSKERKSRLSAIKRHFSKSKDKKARSHSIERSTDIDSSLKSSQAYPDKIQDGTTAAADSSTAGFKRERNSTGGGVRRLFSGSKRSDGRTSKSQPRESSSLPRLAGLEPHLHCTGVLATAVVVASGAGSGSTSPRVDGHS